MSVAQVHAGLIMDRVARLLNDPAKTDYTYVVQVPFLNLAIEEYSDYMVETNHGFFNATSYNAGSGIIELSPGLSYIMPPDAVPIPGVPNQPPDMIEIQEINERVKGDPSGGFRIIPRKEFQDIYPATNSLLYWIWERGIIRFNPPGATVTMEVVIKYVYQGIQYAVDENSTIDVVGARTFLGYRTAALCAMFIGENAERAKVLNDQAELALERATNINSKGKQQIMTRHRPFRAAYKARGGF